MNPENDSSARSVIVNDLSDLIVRYDMVKLKEEAQSEFESIISSRELLGQNAIGQFFNIGGDENARN